MIIRQGQNNRIIKGPLENNHSNHSKHNDNQEKIIQIQSNATNPKKSQIEIELNENQINNTSYDVQSFNDNETSSSNSTNGDAKSTAFNDKDRDKKNDKGEAEDRDEDGAIIPELIGRMAEDAESDSDSDNDSDDENKKGREDNNQTIKETLKITPGFLSKANGIFENSHRKKCA